MPVFGCWNFYDEFFWCGIELDPMPESGHSVNNNSPAT
tara:strand:- start:59 stop:172 length:114 start_codon:yes stop_codon:yes gene_type:complete